MGFLEIVTKIISEQAKEKDTCKTKILHVLGLSRDFVCRATSIPVRLRSPGIMLYVKHSIN